MTPSLSKHQISRGGAVVWGRTSYLVPWAMCLAGTALPPNLDHMVLQNGSVNNVSARLHGLTSARKSPYTNSRHVLLLTKRHFSAICLYRVPSPYFGLYPCPGTRTNCNTSALTAAGRRSYVHRFQCYLQHCRGFLRVQYCGLRKSCTTRPGELSRRLAMFLAGT